MNNIPAIAAYRTWNLLYERKALISETGNAFWVWPRSDRVIIIFDPDAIDIGKINEDFTHRLSTRLSGRRVVRTNSRGLFLQVGYDIPAAPMMLTETPLDLSGQLTPWHMGIGLSERGDLWVSLIEGDSFLIGGMRGFGKTGLLHGFIQSLLHGGKTLVYAWDGKENAEYLRYVGRDNFTLLPMDRLQEGLQDIQQIASDRMKLLARSGHPNIVSYNESGDGFMKPIALVVDEVAEVEDQSLLLRQVKVNRAAGVYPIFATNNPSKAAVVAKSNLGTRIAFPVVSHTDSQTILGHTGANKLPKLRGRGLIERDGRLVEFQAFRVEYPKPSEEALRWLESTLAAEREAVVIEPTAASEVDADRVMEMHNAGKSITAIAKELTGQDGGRVWTRVKKQVEMLITTATTTTQSSDLTSFSPEMG